MDHLDKSFKEQNIKRNVDMGGLSQVFRGEPENSVENWNSCYSYYTLEENVDVFCVCPKSSREEYFKSYGLTAYMQMGAPHCCYPGLQHECKYNK